MRLDEMEEAGKPAALCAGPWPRDRCKDCKPWCEHLPTDADQDFVGTILMGEHPGLWVDFAAPGGRVGQDLLGLEQIANQDLPPSEQTPTGRRAWVMDTWRLPELRRFHDALWSEMLDVYWAEDMLQADKGRKAIGSREDAEAAEEGAEA